MLQVACGTLGQKFIYTIYVLFYQAKASQCSSIGKWHCLAKGDSSSQRLRSDGLRSPPIAEMASCIGDLRRRGGRGQVVHTSRFDSVSEIKACELPESSFLLQAWIYLFTSKRFAEVRKLFFRLIQDTSIPLLIVTSIDSYSTPTHKHLP
jgi:hypothetical protein